MAKILIADDEPQTRSAIANIMREAGHETYEAFDGLGALFDVKELKPDVLLLDWMIPELFGGEVLERLRGDEEYSEVADTIVIVVSDFDDDASQENYRRAGANDFVAKKENLDELRDSLIKRVDAHLAQSQ